MKSMNTFHKTLVKIIPNYIHPEDLEGMATIDRVIRKVVMMFIHRMTVSIRGMAFLDDMGTENESASRICKAAYQMADAFEEGRESAVIFAERDLPEGTDNRIVALQEAIRGNLGELIEDMTAVEAEGGRIRNTLDYRLNADQVQAEVRRAVSTTMPWDLWNPMVHPRFHHTADHAAGAISRHR